jgi:N-acetyl sugar amidotransferase
MLIKYPSKNIRSDYSENNSDPKVYYGLNKEIKFCSKCTYSNQKPTSEKEFKHTIETKKTTIPFSDKHICNACQVLEKKDNIDWAQRKNQLKKLCDKYRKSDGSYDCIVPGSGGKDSFYASYKLKYEFGMNPLTVTWAPHIYTEWGWKNFQSWIHSGFDNHLFTPNGRVHRVLTRLAVDNLFHPFQPFIMGQYYFPARMASKLNIPLVFYGDTNAEFGHPEDFSNPERNMNFFTTNNTEKIFIGGTKVSSLEKDFGLSKNELEPYLPLKPNELKNTKLNIQYLGYYLPWHPQECYYFASEKGNFAPAPERNVGTYQKYASIDDKIDDFHYFTTFIKFGIGRATYDTAQEIRNGEINREEGIALIKKYDGEFPKRFSDEIFRYLSINSVEMPIAYKQFEKPEFDLKYFNDLCDKFRSPHIWKLENKQWQLRNKIWN